MSDVLVEVVKGGWPILGFVMVVFACTLAIFGLLPGVVTRLLARIYPTFDPRRLEMIAELYAVPRWDQPWWVAQQTERALHEGISARVKERRTARSRVRFTYSAIWYPADAGLYFETAQARVTVGVTIDGSRMIVREDQDLFDSKGAQRHRTDWVRLRPFVSEYELPIGSGVLLVRMAFADGNPTPVAVRAVEMLGATCYWPRKEVSTGRRSVWWEE